MRLALFAAVFATTFAIWAALCSAAQARPLVVLLTDPRGTVATDLLAPYAIFAESGAVDVKVAAPAAVPARLTPGFAWVAPQASLAEIDRGPRPDRRNDRDRGDRGDRAPREWQSGPKPDSPFAILAQLKLRKD